MRLEVDGAAMSFGGRRVLTSASLRAEPGRVTGLMGRNGAGKSTLLRIAAGLLRPDHGRVTVDGAWVERPAHHQLARRGLYFLPADGSLGRTLRVGEQLDMMRARWATSPDASLLAALRVEPLRDRPMTRLSGGERRRAALAMAVVRQPHCLLADEPLRDLAPIDREAFGLVLRALAAAGTAVVVTGHEVPELMGVIDRVTWCTGGTTRELGAPEAAREVWDFRREFLGTA